MRSSVLCFKHKLKKLDRSHFNWLYVSLSFLKFWTILWCVYKDWTCSLCLCSTANVTGTVCNYGDVRLIGGGAKTEGLVEICINDSWGKVCDSSSYGYSWSTLDAGVVCAQLGYSLAGMYTSSWNNVFIFLDPHLLLSLHNPQQQVQVTTMISTMRIFQNLYIWTILHVTALNKLFCHALVTHSVFMSPPANMKELE